MNKLFKLSVLALAASASFGISSIASADNNGGAVSRNNVTPGSLGNSQGQVLCTAAINSDGTVAGGLHVTNNPLGSTGRATGEPVGRYQVQFGSTACGGADPAGITAARGFWRWVQPDTLQIGTLNPPVICSTADRASDVHAVWVECRAAGTGDLTDASFMLFLAR